MRERRTSGAGRRPWTGLHLAAILLFMTASVPVSAAPGQGPDWEVSDPAGDVVLRRDGLSATPPGGPASSHIDLTHIRLRDEDEVSLRVTFTVSDLRYSGTAAQCLEGEPDSLDLSFEIRGFPVNYLLRVLNCNGPADGSVLLGAQLCIKVANGTCFPQDLESEIDVAASSIHVLIAKDALVGKIPLSLGGGRCFFKCGPLGEHARPPPGTPTNLPPGETLTRLRATYQARGVLDLSWYDEAPNGDEAPDYSLRQPMANVHIAPEGPEQRTQLVEIGATTAVEIGLVNNAPSRRMIEVSYELAGSAENLSKFLVTAPPRISVPAQETRGLVLFVTVDSSAAPYDRVELVLRGQNLELPGETLRARIVLCASTPLGFENPRLYFHAAKKPVGVRGECGASASREWMNALQEDPLDQREEIRGVASSNSIDAFLEVTLESPAPLALRPLVFDENRPALLNLTARSEVPFEGEIEATLVTGVESSSPGQLVASGRKEVSVRDSKLVSIELMIASSDLVLFPDDSAFILRFIAWTPDVSKRPALMAGPMALRFDAAESNLFLPLVTPPEEYAYAGARALVRLSPQGDTRAFVNPGQSVVFEASLQSFGNDYEAVHIDANLDRSNWTVELAPGSDYLMGSGDSLDFGIIVHAPIHAAEGEAGVVRINATRESAPEERAFLQLEAVATRGFQLGNPTEAFEPDEEARAKLRPARQPEPATPGAGVFMLLAAVFMAARSLARRRR